MAPVSEKIDERILRLLGLEFVFDLDYATYITLINEAIISGKQRLPQEELALLSNEKKRIRSKQGRFKPQKQKITADKFATTKFLKPTVQPISSPVLPSQVQTPPPQPINLSPLEGPLESIKNTLQEFLKFRKTSEEQERRSYEAARRAKREAVLENVQKGMTAVSNAVKTFISPFQGIVDRIWRFIFFTLLGSAFNQLINWFSDPNNQKKVKTLQRFLKDWWPALLGAVVLFFTPFGRFVRGVLRIVGGLTGRLVAQIPKIGSAINALRRVLMRNPLLAGLAIGGAAVGATINYFNQQQSKEEGNQEVVAAEQQVQQLSSGGSILKSLFGFNQAQGNPYAQMFGYGGITSNTGQTVSGFGPDTQLIAAQPGEIVINKRTVDAVGADTLLNLNRYYGGPGANQPKMGRLFNVGGMVGSQTQTEMTPRHPREMRIQRMLEVRGLSPTAAMAITTNIREYNPTYSPNVTQYGGIGIVPPNRIDDFRNFAETNKLDENNIRTQLSFITNGPEFKYFKLNLNRAKTPEEALPIAQTFFGHGNIRTEEQEQSPSSSFMNNLLGLGNLTEVPKKVGGSVFDITPKTGFQIPKSMFPNADTQLVPLALQPGEKGFILTKKAVEEGAVPVFEDLLAKIDPTSNAAKGIDYRADPKVPEIKPLSSGKNEVVNLPDINQSTSSSSGRGADGGSQVPPFSAISLKSLRAMNLSIYGVVGV